MLYICTMEKEKYYIPTIEEFHVGFEYEILGLMNDEITYEKRIISNISEFMILDRLTIRVKYLDAEDIESLGWIDGDTRGMSGFLFNPNTDNHFQMYLHDNLDLGYWYIEIFNLDAKHVFRGIIKNKSELTKLMQQLNIK